MPVSRQNQNRIRIRSDSTPLDPTALCHARAPCSAPEKNDSEKESIAFCARTCVFTLTVALNNKSESGLQRDSLFDAMRSYLLSCTGLVSLKLRAYSAGISISLFPVKAVPAVPAPAPASAPIAAPFPPPATPPISAPRPAPPPIIVAERLPFPFSVRPTAVVSTGTFCPLISTEVSRSPSIAPPLNRPKG